MTMPNLKLQIGGTLPYPWAEFIGRTGISPASAAFSWKGGSQAAVILDLNFGDVVNPNAILSGVLQQILGFADYNLPGIGAIAFVGGTPPTTMTVVTTDFPNETSVGGSDWSPYNGSWVMTQSGGTKWTVVSGGITVTLQPAANSLTLTFSGAAAGSVDYFADFSTGDALNAPFTMTIDPLVAGEGPDTVTVTPASGSSGFITRTLPLQHPMYTQLWASRVSKVEYYGPNAKQGGNNLMPFMGWRQARVYVLFEERNYALLTDAQLNQQWGGNEFFRFVEGPMHVGELSALQRQPQQTGGFQWNSPSGYPSGAINFGVTQQLFKARLRLIWRNVPEVALYGSGRMQNGYPLPAFIVAGQVNSDKFLQYPAGSLLGGCGIITPVPSPFPLNSFTQYPQRLFDVEIPLHYFAPPGGWNKAPFAGDGKWYELRLPVEGGTVANGVTLFPTIAFNEVLFVPYGALPASVNA